MISKILSELKLCSIPFALIQDLGWTKLESSSKKNIFDIENYSFEYNWTMGDLVERSLSPTRLPTTLKAFIKPKKASTKT